MELYRSSSHVNTTYMGLLSLPLLQILAAGFRADGREKRPCHLAGSCHLVGDELPGRHEYDGRSKGRRTGVQPTRRSA